MSQLFGDAAEVEQLRGLELFLLQLRYKEGTLRDAEANNPFLLDNPVLAWVVYSGQVDIFAVPVVDGEVAGGRRHLYRAAVGHVLFGLELDQAQGVGLLVSGLPETKLLQLDSERLRAMAAEMEHAPIVASLIDNWINGLSSSIARGLAPRETVLLDEDTDSQIRAGQSMAPRKNTLWVKQRTGQTLFLGRPELPRAPQQATPLTRFSWLQAVDAGRVSAASTETFLEQDPQWLALADFNKLALAAISANYQQDELTERARLQNKVVARQALVEHSIGAVAAVLNPNAAPVVATATPGVSPLLLACQLVGQAQGIEIRSAPGADVSLKRIALTSAVRVRQVALRGDWRLQSSGPLLAFRDEDKAPMALLPIGEGAYVQVDPATGERAPVTAAVAARLSPFAQMFYRPLPAHPINMADLLRFVMRDIAGDLRQVLFTGVAIGLLALVTPIGVGFLFDSVIPNAAIDLLWQVGVALLLIALATAVLQVSQSIALVRLEGKIYGVFQAAVRDRLLALPAPFFRDYSSGDLGLRALGIQQIRQILSSSVLTSVLSGFFSLFSLALLFYYNAGLALLAVLLALALVVVTSATGYFQVRYERSRVAIEGQISGMTLGIINGITKFRVAGLESRAFALWADSFAQQRRLTYKQQNIANRLAVFNAAYPILAAMAIFAVVAGSLNADFTTGRFLAFNTAFGQVMFAGLQLSAAFTSMLGVVPLYERARPILQTRPEVDGAKADPGELAGAIEISHLSFRYKENGPLILKDISLRIAPGEFVAFVGASGSGKSTLLRMLLGFERAEAGGVYFDGQDLNGLDLRLVRQQIGVVLQHGRLLAGDVFANITGGMPGLTLEDAWQAARMAGMESDIKEMPMGMNTMVSEGGGTFSGGQRQRLLIARAVVNRPRLIFFDEATSALDNTTQDVVSKSLEGLQATRVVIAHRLSTILNADRIFVFDDGRLVQSGTYAELVDQAGPFAELAKRQIG